VGCGICGFVGLSDKTLLQSMCEVSRHRGPDETGYFIDAHVGLGINRLKIIDLVKGDQPIHNEDGTVWTVFNGEIYNYEDLRRDLEKEGHRFYTNSDTETIVHAYEKWGGDCVRHFRGMFAFAIWDSNAKRLLLARDRFGKKPLYYSITDSVLLFSSELKSLLEYEEISKELDYDAIDYFFTYMYVPSPLSIFKSIRKLPPGSYATFEGGVFRVETYWSFELHPDPSMTEDAVLETLYACLEESVRVRMRSDVPLGAFLSGGIDSSTVAALMSRNSDRPVKTVSIGFDNEISETAHSRLVADFLKTDHREYTVSPDAFKILPRLVWHFDEPFADHSMIPTYYLSEVTRREVTVALTGDGGDEMFMGYPFFLDPPSYSLYSKVPSSLRRPSLKLLARLPGDRQFKRMAKHAYDKNYGDQSAIERLTMRMTLYDPAGLRKLYSRSHLLRHETADTYGFMTNLAKDYASDDPLDMADYAIVRSYLEEDILVKVDRMSMAVSLEARCPLLDQEVASLAARMPSNLKMRGNRTKYIFKKMAIKKGLVPREIALRKKQGFGAPIESWMKGEWKDGLSQLLDPVITKNYTGLFDPEHVKSLVAEPYLNSNKLFALMTFVIWHRIYVDGDKVVQPLREGPLSDTRRA
jgi:asparagine synthase (glutamine-hydrolysing)